MNQVFNTTLSKMQKVLENKCVVVCVSTGVDSMTLLHLLQKIDNIRIVIAHVNHHQRIQSNEEQTFICEYAKNNNIECFIKELSFDTHQNFQNNARNKRYDFFKEVMDEVNADFLLTAHHATDDLETILMRLTKSTSAKGYAGIEELAAFNNKYIYRPLLHISKKEIYEYAKENNIKFYEDQSNSEDDYLRNRIRHNIIPVLEEENPSIYREVEIYKEHITELTNMLFDNIYAFINQNVEVFDGITQFETYKFTNLSKYLQEQTLFEILKPYKLSKNLIEQLLSQINNDKNLIINYISDELTFIKEYGYCKFGKKTQREEISLEITGDFEYVLQNNDRILVNKNKCNFETKNGKIWYNINAMPITIRNKRDGDKILINGKLRSLSDYLTNKKVSHFIRDNILVITNSNDEVLFILGI